MTTPAEREQFREKFFADAAALAQSMLADPATIPNHLYEFAQLIRNVHWYGGALPAHLAWPLYHAAVAARQTNLQGDLLISLSRTDPAATLPIARTAMNAQDRSLRDDASEAWLGAQGLPNPFEAIGWIPDRELHEWPLPAQHIYVLCDLINQVTSNGFSGWCCNGYASRWRLTLDACRAVGAEQTAELVQKAVDAFGPFDGMTEAQIEARLHGPQGEVVMAAADRPNGAFWRDDERLRCRMAEYMVKHHKLFAALRPI